MLLQFTVGFPAVVPRLSLSQHSPGRSHSHLRLALSWGGGGPRPRTLCSQSPAAYEQLRCLRPGLCIPTASPAVGYSATATHLSVAQAPGTSGFTLDTPLLHSPHLVESHCCHWPLPHSSINAAKSANLLNLLKSQQIW